MLRVENVNKTFKTKRMFHRREVQAVRELSVEVPEGKCIGLVGESGCGKSTLGRMACGLLRPDSGTITLDGKDIYSRSVRRDRDLKHRIQIVFQDYLSAVDPRMTAAEIIKEPIRNFAIVDYEKWDDRVRELIRTVALHESDLQKYPNQFSGGQLQRIAIARALASDPDYIVLDEPLSSLDVSVQAQILNLLSDLKKSTGISLLLISHDLEAVYYISDEIYVMYAGMIMEYIRDINEMDKVCHPYSKRLLNIGYEQEETVEEETSALDVSDAGCPYCNRCERCTERCASEVPEITELSSAHGIRCFNPYG